MTLRDLLTETNLPSLTDSRSLSRGREYFNNGHVTSLSEHAGKVVADVSGTYTYHVALWVREDAVTVCGSNLRRRGRRTIQKMH